MATSNSNLDNKRILHNVRNNFDFVRFTYADINGISRSKTVCKPAYDKAFLRGTTAYTGSIGFGLNGELGPANAVQSTQEAVGCHNSNLLAKPVLDTLHHLSTAGGGKYRVGEVLCETFHPRTDTHMNECPRYIAGKQLDILKEQFGFEVYSSYEMEFHLVDPKTWIPVFSNRGEMFRGLTFNAHEHVLLDIAKRLEEMAVYVEVVHSEFSGGQFEIALKPQLGIKSADNVFLTKDCVKEVARRHGLKAVFMTKKDTEAVCNGCHFNISLQKDKTNIFSNREDQDKLSEVGYKWLAGLIQNFRAITAMCCPTVNCYRRVAKPWVPAVADWGVEERMAAYRLVNQTPDMTYVECRLPSGSSNPYLVLASVVAAGIDGLRRELSCPLPTERKEVSSLVPEPDKVPRSLTEAIHALEDNQYMLEALGADFVRWFRLLKELEIEALGSDDVRENIKENIQNEVQIYLEYL